MLSIFLQCQWFSLTEKWIFLHVHPLRKQANECLIPFNYHTLSYLSRGRKRTPGPGMNDWLGPDHCYPSPTSFVMKWVSTALEHVSFSYFCLLVKRIQDRWHFVLTSQMPAETLSLWPHCVCKTEDVSSCFTRALGSSCNSATKACPTSWYVASAVCQKPLRSPLTFHIEDHPFRVVAFEVLGDFIHHEIVRPKGWRCFWGPECPKIFSEWEHGLPEEGSGLQRKAPASEETCMIFSSPKQPSGPLYSSFQAWLHHFLCCRKKAKATWPGQVLTLAEQSQWAIGNLPELCDGHECDEVRSGNEARKKWLVSDMALWLRDKGTSLLGSSRKNFFLFWNATQPVL